ncbi:hypothetical protein MUP01_05230 [Candidatus Bathyarchaeota archaeon]|nr:hypothetical protein [Candidatus Bathyarchaeota archaeon]
MGDVHCLLANYVAISVIEEKGEGFENGIKAIHGCLWLSLRPQPPTCIVRLKIRLSYKNIT